MSSWFESGGQPKPHRPTPEQHYVSTMGVDQLAPQQQRPNISSRSVGLPPRTPSARTSRDLFTEPKSLPTTHLSDLSNTVPIALRLDSVGCSSAIASGDSSSHGVSLVAYPPAPMLAWTSPFSSQVQLMILPEGLCVGQTELELCVHVSMVVTLCNPDQLLALCFVLSCMNPEISHMQ